MDENYLDNLLNEFSLDKEIDHKIEEELDEQIQQEKKRRRDRHDTSSEEFDLDLNRDSDDIEDNIELDFSEEQMEELDELDELADLDIGDLDFSDIDFEDVDMTNLNQVDDEGIDDLLKDFEGDLEIDDFFHKQEVESSSDDKQDNSQDSIENQNEISEEKTFSNESAGEGSPVDEQKNEELNADSFNANDFLDSLLEEAEKDEMESQPYEELTEDENSNPAMTESVIPREIQLDESVDDASSDGEEKLQSLDDLDDFDASMSEAQEVPNQNSGDEEFQGSLDDLLSMLDMEGDGGAEPIQSIDDEIESIPNLDDASGATDSVDTKENTVSENESSGTKKKHSLMQILFGDDDDDDDELSEEELEAIAAKKAEKKAAKEAKKAAKKEKSEAAKAQKAQDNDKKKKSSDEKKRAKAELKKQRKAEEAANAEPEKKLNKAAVAFIFTFLLGGLLLFLVVSGDFSYTQVIKKAANYFAAQKYRRAYDEIVGVEVKDKDQELKDRIYTVMYVERLYESYNNNIAIGYEEKALDSLLRGVDKYYEHYDEAVELDILSDLNYSFEQIKQTLLTKYGITVEDAIDINRLENVEYVQTINEYISRNQQNNVPQNDMDNVSKDDAALIKDESLEDETK